MNQTVCNIISILDHYKETGRNSRLPYMTGNPISLLDNLKQQFAELSAHEQIEYYDVVQKRFDEHEKKGHSKE